MKRILSTIFKNVISIFKIPCLFSYYSGGLGTILILHRVSDINHNGLKKVENLKITPELLEKTIQELKKMNYDFISINEVEERILSGNKKRFVVFTLDDGYKDNYTNAYPIFKKYNVPFTIYVTSSFPNKTASLWWYSVADLILKESTIYTLDGNSIDTSTKEKKENAFILLKAKMQTFENRDMESQIAEYLPNYSLSFGEKRDELCLSWEELKELTRDPIVTIGGHTVSHPTLSRLDKNEAIAEILKNKEELEQKLSINVDTFAYPFGDQFSCGVREFDIVKELGFRNAVTTRTGNIFPVHKDHIYSLPRISLTQNYDLRQKMYLISILKNKGKRIDLT